MLKRIVIGLLMVAYVVTAVLLGRTVMLVHVALLLLIGMHEMLDTLHRGGMKPVKWVYYVYAAALLPVYLLAGDSGLLIAVLVGMLGSMALACLRTEPDAKQLLGAMLPVFYPTLPLMCIAMLVCNEGPFWRMMIWLLFALSASSDTMALFAGKFFGKHKLIPRVSPNKTVEGAIGGVVGSLIAAMVVFTITAFRGEGLNVLMFIGLAVVGSAMTQIGDIVASYIKRFCGVKDFGKIFPGHGGLLDRVDGIIFTAVGLCIFVMVTGF